MIDDFEDFSDLVLEDAVPPPPKAPPLPAAAPVLPEVAQANADRTTRADQKPQRREDPSAPAAVKARLEERVPPHDLDAEAAVLSALMLNPEIIDEVPDLQAEEFYAEAHRRTYEAVRELHAKGQPVDIVQVASHLKDHDRLQQVGGLNYLQQILDAAPVVTATHLRAYAARVKDCARLRRLALMFQQATARIYGGVGDIEGFLSRIESEVQSLCAKKQTSGLEHISPILQRTVTKLDEHAKSGESTVGLSTGFKDLDDMIGGLFEGDVTVIGARPGMGKTSFVLGLGENVAHREQAFAIFSLEMPREQLAQRMLASSGGVNMLAIRRAQLSATDWSRITSSASILANLHIYIDDTPQIGLLELAAKIRRLKAKLDAKGVKLGAIAIDYLQLMKMRNLDKLPQSVGEITTGLKALAKEVATPIIALSQLNRGVETRPNKRPHMADLRESGNIEQDADNIIFLYRDEYYDPNTAEPGVVEAIIAKQRNGPTGTVKLAFLKQTTTFHNLATGDYA